MAAALVSIDGAYIIVYGYEPDDQQDPWRVYAPGVPDWVNDLQTLEFGNGYWIRATKAITLYLPIDSRPAAATLATSLPPPPATYYDLALAPGLVVEARINGTRCGQTRTVERQVDGQARAVFVLKVRGAGPGPDAQCGTPGARVEITVSDGTRTVMSYRTVWENSVVRGLRDNTLFLPQLAGGAVGQ